MTLTELSDAWNALRNAALGRGVAPLVPEPLAGDVARQYEAWRAWLAKQGPLTGPLDIAEGVEWIQRYRKLLSRVQKAGQTPAKVLPRGVIEASLEVATNLRRSIAWGLVGTGVGVALFLIGQSRSRRRD